MVLGQQVSIEAARTHAGRIVGGLRHARSPTRAADLTHVFPAVDRPCGHRRSAPGVPEVPAALAGRVDRRAGRRATSMLDAGCDWNTAREQLAGLPGIGPWTAEMIAMRALGDPDAFPATDLGVRGGRTAARSARRPEASHSNAVAVATLALLRHPTPLDRTRPCDQPLATATRRDDDRTPARIRTIDSPVGPLTLAGTAGRLQHLRMVDQTYEPNRDGWERDDDAFPDAVEQLEAYFAGTRTDFDLELDLVGTEFQRRVWQALARSPTARPGPTASWPSRSASRARPAPSAWPTAATRSASSCPAIGSSGRMAASPDTAVDWKESGHFSIWRGRKSRLSRPCSTDPFAPEMPLPPNRIGGQRTSICVRRCPTFPPVWVVSSALAGLASGFGMGPGVSLPLWTAVTLFTRF